MKKYSISLLCIFLIGNLSIDAAISDFTPSTDSLKKYGAPVALVGTAALAGTCLFGAENFGKLCSKAVTTPLVGFAKMCAYAGPKKVIGAASAVVAGMGIYHRFYFYRVNNTLDNSLSADSADKNFLFSTWGINQWQYASDIKTHQNNVKNQLKALDLGEANDKIGITLVAKVAAEKEQFKKWIRFVGSCTDFPTKFVEAMKTKKQNLAVSDISDSDNALAAAGFLKDYSNVNLDTIGKLCISSPQNAIVYTSQWHWWRPTQIALFPFYDKATELCKKLIYYYGRLCVLEQLAKEIKNEPSAREKAAAKLLESTSTSAKLTGNLDKLLPH